MPEALFHKSMAPYLDGLVPTRDAVMQEMETYAKKVSFPIIGPAGGYFNYLIARMTKATRVFELGSGYGYSTSWFAKAVQENGGGVVHHVVWDDKLSQMAREYHKRQGYDAIVKYTVGEAVAALEKTDGQFDLMFNDIDKHGYPASIGPIKKKLRKGGTLIIDNMLWHGQVFDQNDKDKDTEGIREVTRMLTTDPEFITTLVPIRDGMIMAYRK
jgi:caffeoyl-CoA O-methyltransferase